MSLQVRRLSLVAAASLGAVLVVGCGANSTPAASTTASATSAASSAASSAVSSGADTSTTSVAATSSSTAAATGSSESASASALPTGAPTVISSADTAALPAAETTVTANSSAAASTTPELRLKFDEYTEADFSGPSKVKSTVKTTEYPQCLVLSITNIGTTSVDLTTVGLSVHSPDGALVKDLPNLGNPGGSGELAAGAEVQSGLCGDEYSGNEVWLQEKVGETGIVSFSAAG